MGARVKPAHDETKLTSVWMPNPMYAGEPRTLVDSLRRAVSFHQRGRFDKAARIYQQILKVEPDHFDALHLLGVIHKRDAPRRRSFCFVARSWFGPVPQMLTGTSATSCRHSAKTKKPWPATTRL